jgi:Domain of Unknown Function (DUF350)
MRGGEELMKVLTDYLMTLGWAVVGAIAMAIALVLLVRVFTWLTPIDEWAELRQGNVAVAIVWARSSSPSRSSSRPPSPRPRSRGRRPP